MLLNRWACVGLECTQRVVVRNYGFRIYFKPSFTVVVVSLSRDHFE